MNSAIIDSGVLYALFDVRDAWHARCVGFFKTAALEAVVPTTILGEVGCMVDSKLPAGASRAVAEWLSLGRVQLEGLLPQDLRRMTVLLAKYPKIGFVDASVVAIAERLLIDTIATTDRRDFATVRPSHAARFRLVPEP